MAKASICIKRSVLTATVLTLVLVAVAMASLLYIGIPKNAAGMAAKGVCSGAFVAGRPWQKMMAEDVLPASPVLRFINIAVDESNRTVTGTFAGLFPRMAVWLPGQGCVLDAALGRNTPRPTAATHTVPTPGNPDADKPWPQGETPVPRAEWGAGIDAVALQNVVDQAFAGAGDPFAANARGVAIIHKGRSLVLRTAPGFSPQTALHGWSMTKTVTGMLSYKLSVDAGLAFDTLVVDAFAKTREPAWLAAWRNDARKDIKVSDLLYMRDGLASVEEYQPWGSVPQMLWGATDTAAFAAKVRSEAAPGARWRYLSATANLLAGVARGRFATDADYWAYPAKALFGPIGASTAVLESDAGGNWVGSSYLWASVGDWGRLGQLMLNDGRWGDTQVLPPGWLKFAAMASTAQGEGTGYGAQTWRYGDPVAGRCKDNKGVPADTLAMGGHWGQVVAMVPSRDAVIVRLGWTFKRDQFDSCVFVANVLKALLKP